MKKKIRFFSIFVVLTFLYSCATPSISPQVTIKSPPRLDAEQAIKKYLTNRKLAPIEGGWVWDDNKYEVVITKNTLGIETNFDYVGILVDSSRPGWNKGEVKLLLKETASETLFTGVYLMGDRSRYGTTFILSENNKLLRTFLPIGPYGTKEESLILKNYPKKGEENQIQSTGTGFVLGNTKITITNHHVIENAKQIFAIFNTGKKIELKSIATDKANDIAILELSETPNFSLQAINLGNSGDVRMGDKVYTIGYPIVGLLGQKPKFTEGMVNSISGIQDDPRFFQISAALQPGNSGGPLFNDAGEVIGIATASLNSILTVKTTGHIPQNVNYGIKSGYIKNILPDLSKYSRQKNKTNNSSYTPKTALTDFIQSVKDNVVLIETTR